MDKASLTSKKEKFEEECASCLITERHDGISLKKCSKCRLVSYCCKECQTEDWFNGGHKANCIPPNERKATKQTENTVVGDICLVCRSNIDTSNPHEKYTLACSHTFHSHCIFTMEKLCSSKLCPTCRAPLPPESTMFNDEAVIIWENLCSSFRERTGHSMDTNPDSMNKKERKDFERCVTLMTKAAKLGNLDAASFLGYLYERGVMYEKNYKLSAYWFSVCENENPPRRQQCQHGILYITGGYGLSVDRSRGKDLLQLSSLQGDDFAQCILGTLLRDSEIKEERDEALRLLLESATQGNDRSLCDLGIIQYEGIIVTRSYTKAFQLFMKASNLGSPLARYLISGCYLRGHGVRQSDEQAARWLRAAEEIGEDHVREYANNMFQTQSSNDSRRLNVSI